MLVNREDLPITIILALILAPLADLAFRTSSRSLAGVKLISIGSSTGGGSSSEADMSLKSNVPEIEGERGGVAENSLGGCEEARLVAGETLLELPGIRDDSLVRSRADFALDGVEPFGFFGVVDCDLAG